MSTKDFSSLHSVDFTAQLAERKSREPDYQAESAMLRELGRLFAESPTTALDGSVRKVMKFCRSGSAGISIAESAGEEEFFRWHAVSGSLAPYLGNTLPRNFSPCGVTIDAGTTQLMRQPQRHFEYINQLGLPIQEVLLEPIFQSGKAIGTIWAVLHEPHQEFDQEDARLLRSISSFTSAILQSRARDQELKESLSLQEETNKQLKRAVDVAKVGFFDWDVAKNTIYFSSQMQSDWGTQAGTSLEEIVGLIHRDDRDRVLRSIQHSLSERVPYSEEYRITDASTGQEKWIEAKGEVIEDEETGGPRFIGTSRDITERKMFYAAREHNLTQLESFFSQVPMPIAIFRCPELSYAFANDAYEEMVGRKVMGKKVADIFLEEEVSRFIPHLKAVYETGVPFTGKEMPVVLNDARGGKRKRVLEVAYHPYYELGGKIRGVLSIHRDVTEMVAAREKLVESGEYFRSMVDSSPAMIWLTDETSRCTYLSEQWYQFTGRTPKQDLGFGWLENIHPDDLEETSRVYANAVRDKGPLKLEYRLRRKDGSYRWAIDLGNPRFNRDGDFIGYIGTVTDIHDRVVATEELRFSQSRFSRSAEATQLGIWSVDAPFTDLHWNSRVKEHFFLPEDATVTMADFYEMIVPEDRDRTRAAVEESVHNRQPYNIVYRTFDRKDPSRVNHIRAVGWTDYSEDGRPIRFDGITLDVTEEVLRRNALEASRQQALDAQLEADRANAAKSAFLANMSHEIRTPLGAIMGFSDLARNRAEAREQIDAYLETIHRNSVQVLRIVDDILDLAKVEAGRMDIEHLSVKFISFLADFSSIMGFKARENGIQFRMLADSDLPENLLIDPTRVRQVLNNAVGNALKFTAHGEVTLRVRHQNNELSFAILDTGRGISADQSRNLFQAFSQGDISTTRKFGGTGLGLILTKKLCQSMGGDFWLEKSEVGVGSHFEARISAPLPPHGKILAQDSIDFLPDRKRVPAPQPEDQLKGIKVLLVEDSPDNQELLQIILEQEGAIFSLAKDGLEGVEKALNGDHDVVVMDVQMPVLDGHEAIQRLKAQGYSKPVIALTAHAMKEEYERAIRSGFAGYLTKPLDRNKLIDTVAFYGKSPAHR